MDKPKIIAVAGSTGTGKTALSVRLAKELDGEVISCDSMQVYTGMDIGTAKVTAEEMSGIRHHLIDIQPYWEPYNVKIFQEKCREAIDDILSRGKVPVLAGGTGLYMKAALYDYHFEEEPDLHLEWLQKKSNEELVELLEQKDPAVLEKIHPNNRKRLLRAAGMAMSGKTKTQREKEQKHELLYDVFLIGLTADKEVVDQRIEERANQMFEKGLAAEVESLFSDPVTWSYSSFQGIGYKEFREYFEGKCSLEEVRQAVIVHSRQYAKRQMTWYRHQMDVKWYELYNTEQIIEDIKEWYYE